MAEAEESSGSDREAIGSGSDREASELNRLASYAEKAEIYVVSLTFTILALSAQFPVTVESTNLGALRFQAGAWILLTISGIAGIKILRNVSSKYSFLTEGARKRHFAEQLLDQVRDKIDHVAYAVISKELESWNEIGKHETRLYRQFTLLFPLQGYSFVLGILSQVAARILALPCIW